jgi:hypothetical protein
MTQAPWLRVLVYQDLPGLWVARTLEHDIVVEGQTIDEAVDAIMRIVVAHVEFDQRHGRHPLSAFPAAPARYWTAFEVAAHVRTVTCNPLGRARGSAREVVVALTQDRPLPTGFRPPAGQVVVPAPHQQSASARPARLH